MKVPIEWLKELVSFRAGPDQLAKMLTMGGLETVLLPEDVLDVDVLPNRADCWSLRGIAREVSALTKFKTKKINYKVKEGNKKTSSVLKVEVRDKDLCPRYMARVIQNVKIGDSPEWLKKKLAKTGLRSINNVVDVTNYLLLEIGQPMHAFDSQLIKDQTVIVRRANPEEKVTTIDGKEQLLTPEVLVISDPEKVIAIAGVMGAANTEVGPLSRTIILESAYFNPIAIHKTSKNLKTRSESSVRFEHGVDWNAVEESLDRGAALIAELGRGEVLKGKIDLKAGEKKMPAVELRLARIKRIIGTDIPQGEVISILKRLGFIVGGVKSGVCKVTIPLFRAMDIEREIDIIEEIARIYGYGRIDATMPSTAFPGKTVDREDMLRHKIREIAVGCGLNEVQSYSMLAPKDFERIGLTQESALKITNPLTVEESVLRTYLLPGLLKVAEYNQHRQVTNVFIFEIGRIFNKNEGKPLEERWKVGALVMGSPFLSALDKGEADYHYLKGIIDNLFAGLGMATPPVKEADSFLLQPGKGAAIEELGIFGALHPDLQQKYGFQRPVFFFEFDLETLFKMVPKVKNCQPLPKFPAVARDISMFIPSDLTNQIIVETVRKAGGELVEDVYPFDKYKDSIAYRVVYRDPAKTLTEEEVNARHRLVVNELTDKLMVRIR